MVSTTTYPFVVNNWKYFMGKPEESFLREGYALPNFQFKFSFPSTLNTVSVVGRGDVTVKRFVRWDFGDGNSFVGAEAVHSYASPGTYTVKVDFYDFSGGLISNNFTAKIKIFDFISDSITVTNNGSSTPKVSEYIPFTVAASVSQRNKNIAESLGGIPVILHATKQGTNTYLTPNERAAMPYHHIVPSFKFARLLNGFSFVESPIIKAKPVYYYFDTDLNPVVTEDAALSVDDVIVGYRGTEQFFFATDFTNVSNFDILCSIDPTKTEISSVEHDFGAQHINNFARGFTISSISGINTQFSHTITSNGIDGERTNVIQTYFVGGYKFIGVPFSVVVKKKFYTSGKAYSAIGTDKIQLENIDFALVTTNELGDDTVVSTDITAVTSDVNENTKGGYWKGLVTVNSIPTQYIKQPINLRVRVSNGFYEYSRTIYLSFATEASDICKINEAVNMTESMLEFNTQQHLSQYIDAIKPFVNSIVGDHTSKPSTFGKQTHEKVSNMPINKRSMEAMDVDSVCDISQLFDEPIKSGSNIMPADVQRLVNIGSQQISTLIGTTTEHKDIFITDDGRKGPNLGDLIALGTSMPSNQNKKIVAYEIFSKTFVVVNCNRMSLNNFGTLDDTPFVLSDCITEENRVRLNWPLILPNDITPETLSKYYRFYSYIPTERTLPTAGTLDFESEFAPEYSNSFKSITGMSYVIEREISKNISSGISG